MQGLLGFRASIVAEDRFFAAAGDARISAVDVRDIAAVAAAALTEDRHAGRTYDITGTADGFLTDKPSFRTNGTFAIKVSC